MRAARRAGRYLPEIPRWGTERHDRRSGLGDPEQGAQARSALIRILALRPGWPRYDAEVVTGDARGRDQFPWANRSRTMADADSLEASGVAPFDRLGNCPFKTAPELHT